MPSLRRVGVSVLLLWPAVCALAAEGEDTPGPDALKARDRLVLDTAPPAPAGPAATNGPPTRRTEWHAAWKGWDGLHFELHQRTLLGDWVKGAEHVPVLHLEETRMAGKIGAKVAADAAAFVADDDFTGFDAGAELRRIRIYARGDCLMVLPVSYEVEIGYIPNEFYIENSYLKFRNLGFLGDLQAGQFQAPMTLENYGSSRDMMFMEAASPLQALAPGVNAGFQVGRPVAEERMTWAAGLFTDSVGDDIGDATSGFARFVGRVTGLPVYQDDPGGSGPSRLLHVGLSGTLLYAADSAVRYRSRPESHLAPYVVDTGDLPADASYAGGAEAAWVEGPLCLQAEYVHVWVQGASAPDAGFGGFYLAASWFLTGESRPYDRQQGIFTRVIPRRSFDPRRGGWGAWEVAARVSHVDLNDTGASGGRLTMLLTGVNWHLHPHVKWRFNYGFGQVSGRSPEGDLNIFQTRVELDF
ncbi:MAG: OprO/OprP family phosphate-selective porin [Limisphaerales bacterium]